MAFLARAIHDIEKTDQDQVRYIRAIFLYLGNGNLQKKEIMDALKEVEQPTGERFVSLWEALFGDREKEMIERVTREITEKVKAESLRSAELGKLEEAFHVFRNGLREGVPADLLLRLTGVEPGLAMEWKTLLEQNPAMMWEEAAQKMGY